MAETDSQLQGDLESTKETIEIKEEKVVTVETDISTSSEATGNGTSKVDDEPQTQNEENLESEIVEPAINDGPEKAEEEVTPKVILHQFPPGKNIPSVSIFCLKLETFLRINKIPYENQYGYKLGKKGKLPWIEYKGERKYDSSFIVDYLKEKFELKLDNELSNEKNALGRAIKTMLEENTYWCLSFNRYVDNYNEYKKIIAPSTGAGIGFNVGQKMAQRKVRTCLDSQGLGRHTPEEIYHIMEKDIMAVSALLGENQYILGESISSYDCSVFSFFANILWCGLDTPIVAFIKENAKNLVSYCERMKEDWWLDWSEMVLGDKPEPLKKGFSFRKKRSRPTKPKQSDDDKDEEGGGDQPAEACGTNEEESNNESKEVTKEDEKATEESDDKKEEETKPDTEETKQDTDETSQEKPTDAITSEDAVTED